jgi:hypothetical protein
MRRGLGSSDYGPTNTDPNIVRAVTTLGLPQQSAGLGAIPGNPRLSTTLNLLITTLAL